MKFQEFRLNILYCKKQIYLLGFLLSFLVLPGISNAQWHNAKLNRDARGYADPNSKSEVVKKFKKDDFVLALVLDKEAKYITVWDIETNKRGFVKSSAITIESPLKQEDLVEYKKGTEKHDHTNLFIENTTYDSLTLQLGDSTYKFAPYETKNIALKGTSYPYWAIQKEAVPDYGFITLPDSSDYMLKIMQEFNEDKMLEMELTLNPLHEEKEYDMYQNMRLDTVVISTPPKIGYSKSGYDQLQITTGTKSVDADLLNDDLKKDAWVNVEAMDKPLDHYYDYKRYINLKYNVAIGMDYMFLGQSATYVKKGESIAASGIYRLFGTWEPFSSKTTEAALIFKLENRHSMTSTAPRQLGYEAGSALSTASFKEMGWGLTNLYWRQSFDKGKYAYVVGIMDPGDFIDLFPLLNPYKFYLSEAFFNNPAMAIPNQGFGAAALIKDIVPNVYLAGGFHDANGEPTYFIADNFQSFKRGEYLYWVELGWNTKTSFLEGENVHVTYWYQDARTDQEGGYVAEASQGICFSAAKSFHKSTTFFRAAISEGDGALMRYMVMGGYMYNIAKSDNIGIGVNVGEPSDPTVDESQFGLEMFYNMQVTEHLNFTPDVQLTVNPVYTQEKDAIAVFSMRFRYAL
ncbi:hypothetical protein EI427_01425 [Flammeovirga pectinis]|uniref:Carbohydrate porin n=1 Tax=Flammeovirga pectinis TaxID=2494373 RepID=A0A3Q9FII0_9BACT|nr:carbohydrate porin [Flammeovirga pectinis]AZQ60920.1 hypothetical protein EI427_01425 [Flammeovirga pectinis]